ncbi:MAG: hypothetical protein IJ307_06240, partial [Bacteroidales bacterium]|nr:hypothetical protein [Bacteroidales bacterium]MBQ8048328.1 hypothetical protein [Bacteroidales bacterium]
KDEYTEENYTHGVYIHNYSRWGASFIGKEISGTSYDVAHVTWGGGARMPTFAEVKELLNNCTFKYGTYNGVSGDYVVGPNGNSIFLPFAGYRYNDDLCDEGYYGYFWSGTFRGYDYEGDRGFDIFALGCDEEEGFRDYSRRYPGLSVRPVTEK